MDLGELPALPILLLWLNISDYLPRARHRISYSPLIFSISRFHILDPIQPSYSPEPAFAPPRHPEEALASQLHELWATIEAKFFWSTNQISCQSHFGPVVGRL